MLKLIFAISVTILLMLTTVIPYYINIGSWLEFSDKAQDWGLFGDYFGGVAGTLIAFVSVVMLGITLFFQQKQIVLNQEQMLKQDILLQITKVDDEIERWLNRDLAAESTIGSKYIKFGDLVWGLVSYKDSFVNLIEFNRALEKLLKLTCSYCAAINLYEDNINSHFVHHHYRQKASEIVSFLEGHKEKLNPMASISLDFCKMHLSES